MVVLIDTNVAINFLTNRKDDNTAASAQILQMCGKKEVDGYIASHSIPVIWYVLRKYSERDRRTMLRNLCTVVSVVGVNQDDVITALEREAFSDFEDCLQDQCAQDIGADYIITCNVRDFGESITEALSPIDFLKKQKLQ